MDLIASNQNSLEGFTRRSAKLRRLFSELNDNLAALQDPQFPVQGITTRPSDDSERIHIGYRSISIDLILTMTMVKQITKGRVTVMVVKHPLASKPFKLDGFIFDDAGVTDIQSNDGFGSISYLQHIALDLVLTVAVRAAHLDPESIPA
ncbi:hypothetical protein PEC18_18745 [Paucibacter sp. O1-1]|nr:hypothetical protein [Paucibacter sp. O1-1]MDA3827836.1 hypothetical protein [Paucibacter sp. O1-1]